MAKKKTVEKRPAYWIAGNYYDSQRAWKKVLASAGDDVNVESLDCSFDTENTPRELRACRANEIIQTLKHDDLFDDRPRIIRLLGCPPDYTILHDYLYLVDDRNILVICGPTGYWSAAGVGLRFNHAKASKLYKTLNSWGTVVEFAEDLKKSDACKWIRSVASDLGLTMDQDAALHLVDLKGGKLDLLYSELTKLIDYAPKSKKIDAELVKECCVPLFTKTVWELIDSLDSKDYDDVVEHITSFFDVAGIEVGASFYGDTLKLLGALHQHFYFLLLVKSRCGNQLSFQGAVDAVKDFKKKDGTTDLFSYGFVRMNYNKTGVQESLRWSIGKLHAIMLDLYRCEFSCRFNSQNRDHIRRSIMSFAMFVCDKISLDGCIQFRGKQFGFLV